MKKFLNFSTILFSYVLITVLVISCGGSSGGGGGTGGTGGNGGGSVPQPEPKDTTCLLADRADKDSWVAILCYDGVVFGKIRIPISSTDEQSANLLIPSIESPNDNTTRAWDLSKAREIQISHVKEYTPIVDIATEGSIAMIADATDDAAYLLQLLTINSDAFITNTIAEPREIHITFIQASVSDINVNIVPKLAVKSQDDFISMGRFTVPPLGELGKPLGYVLENDIDLVANESDPDAKFYDSIIPIADASFDFDGGGHTINLNSEIDSVAADKPAAIIGQVTKGMDFENVTVNINDPISGTKNVGAILGYTAEGALSNIFNMKVNINRNITLYKSADNADGYLGGVAGSGNIKTQYVLVKTGDGAVIQVFVKNNAGPSFASAVGGLTGKVNYALDLFIDYNVVDVTLGVETSGDGFAGHDVSLGGLTGVSSDTYIPRHNLVKLAISRGNIPADFAFNEVGGLSANSDAVGLVNNHLVYADFSNLGKVKVLGGLFGNMKSQAANIANNMVFIADVFTGSDVQESFGAAIAKVVSGSSTVNVNRNFVSSPVTDEQYNNTKLASLVRSANSDMTFNNLILDNIDKDFMFKGGTLIGEAKDKVADANLFTLAEAKTTPIGTLFSGGNTSWEAVSGGYPQLRTPSLDLTAPVTKTEIEAAWTATKDMIQTELAAREASQQEAQ